VLEIAGPADGLLDDPLELRARGGGADAGVQWRARLRDDDGRAWRSVAPRAEELGLRWAPSATEAPSRIPALGSLRPVAIDVRAEVAGGAAARTVTRRLAAEGVRRRRWRDGLAATLHLPSGDAPRAVALLDATGDPGDPAVAVGPLTGSLLASRGVLTLVVGRAAGRGAPSAAEQLARAAERLAAVPAAARAPVRTLSGAGPPPGIGVRGEGAEAAVARAVAWDALLEELGALPRLGVDRAATAGRG